MFFTSIFDPSFIERLSFSACSVLLAGDDTGSVWLYDMESCLAEAKTRDKHDIEQTQVMKNTLYDKSNDSCILTGSYL